VESLLKINNQMMDVVELVVDQDVVVTKFFLIPFLGYYLEVNFDLFLNDNNLLGDKYE